MKPLSNTVMAGIFAVFLTGLVAALLNVPSFANQELFFADILMKQCYDLHKKYSPHPPDQHLIILPIDIKSVQVIGRWPFPRSIHGEFLQDIAPEKPKVVAWDILFTEPTEVQTSVIPAPAPDASAGTTPASSTPTPASSTTPPPSDNSGIVPPAGSPPATPAAPPVPPAPTPDNSGTNAAPASTPPTTSTISPSSYIGADPSSLTPSGTPTSSAAAPPSAPAPEATNPAAPAPDSSAPASTSENISLEDQALAEGAALFPNMITCAEPSSTGPAFTDKDFLPTKPLKNVTGDISQLLFAPSANLPIPILRKVSYFGFASEDTTGGVRRTMPLVVNIHGTVLPSLDLQVLMQYWDVDPDKVVINLGHEITLPRPDGTQARIPIDSHGFITLNYRARLADFQGESYVGAIAGLEDKAAGKQSPPRQLLPNLKDNIVVIGVDLNGTDMGVTPLETNTPLVDAHLNALNNILQNDFLRPLSPWIWMPAYALFLFVCGLLMLRVGIAPLIPIGIVAVLLLASTAFAALWFANIQVPVAMPEVGLLLLAGAVPTKRFWGEEREKIRVRNAMRAYLSEKVMSKVLAHPDNVKLGGVKQEITIMFCDIRGFTKYCDNRDSGEVLQVLNDYMEEMTQVVFKYDGTVDKYIGDCIMAFWNAPDVQPDHAQRAVCCAMEMRYALANFKTKRAGKDTELFECGIGIHTGEALVGNMGSSLKLNYTAMGSTVNLASRLESLTKRLNERILISEDTLKQLQGDFPLTDRGEAVVPGFANPIHVYAVVAEQDLVSALKVGRTLAGQQEYTAEEASEPIWKPAPLPKDADPN
ncbi:MAG: CHASE2 domain-containing protein [Methylacidiphilales bacterium]|nr:CHASE2 domain-containing protein [Candidatus Methylacidiphilales bacterium]